MLAHKSLVEDLVDLVVGRPLVADYVVSDGLDELVVNIVPGPLIL